MVYKVLEVVEELSSQINMEVIDPRTLVPLDVDAIIKSVKKTERMLIVHEAPVRGGAGAEILRQVVENAFGDLRCAPKVLGGLNTPVPFSPALEDTCIPQKKDIAKAVREMVEMVK